MDRVKIIPIILVFSLIGISFVLADDYILNKKGKIVADSFTCNADMCLVSFSFYCKGGAMTCSVRLTAPSGSIKETCHSVGPMWGDACSKGSRDYLELKMNETANLTCCWTFRSSVCNEFTECAPPKYPNPGFETKIKFKEYSSSESSTTTTITTTTSTTFPSTQIFDKNCGMSLCSFRRERLCPEGYGDCDKDIDCEPGLKCCEDKGKFYGCKRYVDICLPSCE